MIAMEKEDWIELVKTLKSTEESLAALNGGDCEKEVERSRQSLQSFHTTAAMFGLTDLEKVGIELQKYLTAHIAPGGSVDAIATFGFAVSSLIEQMESSKNGASPLDSGEIFELLGVTAEEPEPAAVVETAPASAPEPAASDELNLECRAELSINPSEPAGDACQAVMEENPGYSRLSGLVKNWGGELSVVPNGGTAGYFSLTFTGPAESLFKLERLLGGAPPAVDADPAVEPAMISDERVEKILQKGREFMDAFSAGDIEKAQDILASLSEQQFPGLYKEIGGLARGLHDSIRTFLTTLDPSLKEMVEDKIPDSGNRLEHMLELTEKAAIITLDHTEAMQERLVVENDQVSKLRSLLTGLKPIGERAGQKLGEGATVLDGLEDIVKQHRSDLDAILTAQDYQDLSGQIIMKITALLKDIELRLVNLIKTFGVKVDGTKHKKDEELYGPAHQAREDAVHSQDEVDSLLAEFGF